MTGIKSKVRLMIYDGDYVFSVNFTNYRIIASTPNGQAFLDAILAEEVNNPSVSLLHVSFLKCVDYKTYECCLGVVWCVAQEVSHE